MHVFLSYSNDQRANAEEVAARLRSDGHEVFFDRESLPPGEAFDSQIREAINQSDCLVALLSKDFVAPGRYTLSELHIAEEKWPNPAGRILPVLVERMPVSEVPAYLKSVTFFEPKGNLAAEVLARLKTMERNMGLRRFRGIAIRATAGLALAALVVGGGVVGWRWLNAVPLEKGFDFLAPDVVKNAVWSNGSETISVRVDNEERARHEGGDVHYHKALPLQLEDGSAATNALFTHPKWVSNGIIQGTYGPFRIGDDLKLRGQVGFAYRSRDGDGVRYRVLLRSLVPGVPDIELHANNEMNDGRLTMLEQSLAAVAGKVGYIVLEVNTKADAGADWASWSRLRIE